MFDERQAWLLVVFSQLNGQQRAEVSAKGAKQFVDIILSQGKNFLDLGEDEILWLIRAPKSLHRFPKRIASSLCASLPVIEDKFEGLPVKIFLSNKGCLLPESAERGGLGTTNTSRR